MMTDIGIERITVSLNSILADTNLPKNLKDRINSVIAILNKDDGEFCLRLNKGLTELEEIGNDTNISPYIRTQLWNLITTLEKMLTVIE